MAEKCMTCKKGVVKYSKLYHAFIVGCKERGTKCRWERKDESDKGVRQKVAECNIRQEHDD